MENATSGPAGIEATETFTDAASTEKHVKLGLLAAAIAVLSASLGHQAIPAKDFPADWQKAGTMAANFGITVLLALIIVRHARRITAVAVPFSKSYLRKPTYFFCSNLPMAEAIPDGSGVETWIRTFYQAQNVVYWGCIDSCLSLGWVWPFWSFGSGDGAVMSCCIGAFVTITPTTHVDEHLSLSPRQLRSN
jgi:hypothetical protein